MRGKQRVDRREFIRLGAFATAGLSAVRPLSLLADGGPTPGRRGAPKRVIVVGAGLAGLSAAYELTAGGHEVTVLEAQTRPGGRVLTLREPFSDGLYAEAGAMVIPDTHDLTLKYCSLFGLTLSQDLSSESGLGDVLHLRGKRILGAPGEEPDYPFDLEPEEDEIGPWTKYVVSAAKTLGNPAAADWSADSFREYDDLTYLEFLQRQGASSEAIASLTAGLLWGDGPETVSALTVLRDAVHQNAGSWYAIRGGNDLLPKAFATRLAEKIHYGSPVVKIEQDDHGVRAVVLEAGTHRKIDSDYLVCAIPFSVLRRVDMPPLSPEKERAIRELPYFSAARISLQSRKRFWVDQGLNGAAWTDLPIMSVHNMTSDQPGPRGILQAYMGGPEARRMTRLTEDERISFTVRHMEEVYPGIREHFEGGASKCWDEDPWARGASSWYKPGQFGDLWPHIGRPEGRLHFAGDHTSAWIRWMQGALESGNRVAQEINEAA